MAGTFGRAFHGLREWFGGWRLLLLVLVVAVIAGGLFWERWRHPPLPEGAQQINTTLIVDIRQTTYRIASAPEAIRAFYRQALPGRGWSYCGTQATAGCTNLPKLIDRPAEAIDVYRQSGDAGNGPTIEIWPIDPGNGQAFVTVFETRSK